jgi:hypothetical protein
VSVLGILDGSSPVEPDPWIGAVGTSGTVGGVAEGEGGAGMPVGHKPGPGWISASPGAGVVGDGPLRPGRLAAQPASRSVGKASNTRMNFDFIFLLISEATTIHRRTLRCLSSSSRCLPLAVEADAQ